MKYIEELKPGDLFIYQDHKFLLTTNYRKRQENKIHHEVIDINNGSSRWMPSDNIVSLLDLYYRDKEGHILLLKEFRDDDKVFENKNIS